MEEFDPLKLDNQLCFPLYAASREVIKRYYPYLSELGLTYTQYVCMLVLWEEKTISARDLGAKLYLDSGTLTPVLRSMEAKGLITRQRSQSDERVMMVSLTGEGEALRERALSVPEKVAGCVRLEPSDAVQLYSLLYKVLGGLSESKGENSAE